MTKYIIEELGRYTWSYFGQPITEGSLALTPEAYLQVIQRTYPSGKFRIKYLVPNEEEQRHD